MSDPNPFSNLPGFGETIARIARVPPKGDGLRPETHFVYAVRDEVHRITYKFISPRPMTAADVRKALSRAFARTDVWPNEAGEVEIQA